MRNSRINTQNTLLHRHCRDLQFGIRLVPLFADVLEDQAEGFALAGRKWGDAQVGGVVVRATRLKQLDGNVFYLCDLAVEISKCDLHDRVGNGLVSGVGERAVNVGDAGADEVLCLAHLEIAEL